MGLLDKLFKKDELHDDWKPAFQGILADLSYDDIVTGLGPSQKAKDGYVYWRGPTSMLDSDFSDDQFFQLSNKNLSGFGKPRKLDAEEGDWYVLATSEKAIRQLANELGCVAREVGPAT
jgi:hypothetical protein